MDKVLNSSHLKRLIILYNMLQNYIYLFPSLSDYSYSTVTALARFRGLSTSVPFSKAT